MKRLIKITFVIACLIGYTEVHAQDAQTDNHVLTLVVPNVALLDLESSGSKDFTAAFVQATPLEAGQKLTEPGNNNSVWLNYSSIISNSGIVSRRVTVAASAVVPGVSISVLAGAATTGAGTKGSPTAPVTLTTSAQNLVTGIGSAYTGTGVNYGHNLTYTFAANDGNYGSLRVGSTPVTVTYTLVDN